MKQRVAAANQSEDAPKLLPTAHLLVFGSCNVDMTVQVAGPLHGPERVKRGLDGSPAAAVGGRGLNQAVDCARIGVPTHLIALAGSDGFGGMLHHFLEQTHRECLLEPMLLRAEGNVKTGLTLVLFGEDTDSVQVPCLAANRAVGLHETNTAIHLIDEHLHLTDEGESVHATKIGFCMLALEIPIEASRRVAMHAAQHGCFVALMSTPLDASNVQPTREMLADGAVRLLVASSSEVRDPRTCHPRACSLPS
jgi:ribokinase